jgi:hypothetical protein
LLAVLILLSTIFRQGFQEVGEEVFASAYPSTFLALNFSKKITP